MAKGAVCAFTAAQTETRNIVNVAVTYDGRIPEELMVLCRDCQFYRVTHERDTHCHAPQNLQEPDYVNGGTRRRWYTAESCRDSNESCSPAGKWFRARIAAVQT